MVEPARESPPLHFPSPTLCVSEQTPSQNKERCFLIIRLGPVRSLQSLQNHLGIPIDHDIFALKEDGMILFR